jgi:hypothetical protein
MSSHTDCTYLSTVKTVTFDSIMQQTLLFPFKWSRVVESSRLFNVVDWIQHVRISRLHILTSGTIPGMPDSESLYIEFLFSTGKKLGSRSSSKLWRLGSFYRSCLAQAQENVPQAERLKPAALLRRPNTESIHVKASHWNHLQECRCVNVERR